MGKSDKLEIILVRHAESKANANGVVDTNIPGTPLTPSGIHQAQKLANNLRLLKDKVATVYVSPFLRAQQTAKIIAQTLALDDSKIITNIRIREFYHGELNGLPTSETVKEMEQFLKQAAEGNYHFRVGTFGENQFELLDRLYDFLIFAYRKYKGQKIMVVAHGVVTTVIQKILLEALDKKEKHKSLGNAEFCPVEVDKKTFEKIVHQKQSLHESR